MKISVITVCYNSVTTLQDTLESVLRQTYPDVEYIVVDGASKDGTKELIEKYAPKFSGRMKWISEPDQGIYDAMNKGIRMAEGDVIGFLNGDDYYQDNLVLEDIARAFALNRPDAVHGNLSYVNSRRQVVRTWQGFPYRPGAFQKGWNPAHPTFYCTRRCFEQYGMFDPSIGSAADFELMLRFIEKHRISTHYLNHFMVFMRTGGSSTAGLSAVLRNTRQNRDSFKKIISTAHGIIPYQDFTQKFFLFNHLCYTFAMHGDGFDSAVFSRIFSYAQYKKIILAESCLAPFTRKLFL